MNPWISFILGIPAGVLLVIICDYFPTLRRSDTRYSLRLVVEYPDGKDWESVIDVVKAPSMTLAASEALEMMHPDDDGWHKATIEVSRLPL